MCDGEGSAFSSSFVRGCLASLSRMMFSSTSSAVIVSENFISIIVVISFLFCVLHSLCERELNPSAHLAC